MMVRSILWWALGGTSLLAALVVWGPLPASGVVQAVAKRRAEPSGGLQAAPSTSKSAAWGKADWLTVLSDPFELAVRPSEPKPAAPMAVSSASEAAASAPSPPQPNLRFLGRFVQPDGKAWLYLARERNVIAVQVGDRLDEGYVVEAIEPQGVVLVYPADGSRRVITIPEAADLAR